MSNVIIYTTPTCHFCGAAKAFLKENGISYQDVNVAEDADAADEMIKKSGQMGVPVIDVDGQIIVGFDKPRLAQAIGV